jgi:hypothetical protein
MITAPAAGQLSRPVPPDARAEDSERQAPLCTHCGAVGTHYLTCTSLRLPAGYRPGDDSGVPARDGAIRLSSGPGHPDWPRPPQRSGRAGEPIPRP